MQPYASATVASRPRAKRRQQSIMPLPMILLLPLLPQTSGSSSAATAPPSPSRCYRRAAVNISECAKTTPTSTGGWYTTYTRPTHGGQAWVQHVGLNCFTNKAQGYMGGATILPEPYSRSIALPGCEAACLADLNCSAIVVPTDAPVPPSSTPDAVSIALQKQVNAAIASAAQSIRLPGGTFHFGETNFQILGARNLALLAPRRITLWFAKGKRSLSRALCVCVCYCVIITCYRCMVHMLQGAGVNITNSVDLSLGNITIDYHENIQPSQQQQPPKQQRQQQLSGSKGAITLNLLNSTRVAVSDVNINAAKFMVITAFNGGGAHTFSRVNFEPTLGRHWYATLAIFRFIYVLQFRLCGSSCSRDALHFSDQRVGPTFNDCVIGYPSKL